MNPNLSLSDILQIVQLSAVLSGGAFAFLKFGRLIERFELTGAQQSEQIQALREEVKAMNLVLSNQAVQNEKLNHMDGRITRLESWYDELRHGEGFVLPLIKKSPGEV